jgi:hypothetical protein
MSTAFEATPPTINIGAKMVQLRPLAPLSWKRIQKAAELTDEFGDTALALGYIVTHSVEPRIAAEITSKDDDYKLQLEAAAMEIDLEDLQRVADYLSGVFSRSESARVDVPEKPAAG